MAFEVSGTPPQSVSHAPDYFLKLDDPALAHVLSFIPFQDQIERALTCKRFNQLTNEHIQQLAEEVGYPAEGHPQHSPKAYLQFAIDFHKLSQTSSYQSVKTVLANLQALTPEKKEAIWHFFLNPNDQRGQQILAKAASFGWINRNDPLIDFLLNHGTRTEQTLHLSSLVLISSGSPDVLNAFLKAGIDPNLDPREGDLGYTPLHHAAERGWVEIIEALTRHGAEVNATNDIGDTPLHLAVSNVNSVSAVRQLLKAEANRYAQNQDGLNPAAVAAEQGNFSIRIALLPTAAFKAITAVAITAICMFVAALFLEAYPLAAYFLFGGSAALLITDAVALAILLKLETRRIY